ncbi:MAG: amino acid ABC transporter permease [Ensifer sp. SSB1]|nr:amino acid ABC transporter permease [Ensifer sp. SSB1]
MVMRNKSHTLIPLATLGNIGKVALAATALNLQLCSHALAQESSSPGAVSTLVDWMPFILKGFSLNLAMSLLAMIIATILGVILGLMQISEFAPIRWIAKFVTQVFRNSPWLVILFVVMLLVPFRLEVPGIGLLGLPDWTKATFAFSLPVMANISEIVRGAIASIPRGQWDSAESLAFTRLQSLRYVILPQCVKRSIPPWMNWYAILTLATPMASILGVEEAVNNAQAAMNAAGSKPEYLVPFYLFVMALFFLYIYPIALWTRKLEKTFAVRI